MTGVHTVEVEPEVRTVFGKTRSAEAAEVARALQAQKTCEAEHGRAHNIFDRAAS